MHILTSIVCWLHCIKQCDKVYYAVCSGFPTISHNAVCSAKYKVYYVSDFDMQQVNPCRTFAYYAQNAHCMLLYLKRVGSMLFWKLCVIISVSFWCAQTSRRLGQRERPSPAEDQSGPPLPTPSGHSGAVGPQHLQVMLRPTLATHSNFTRNVKSEGAVDFFRVWARRGPRVLDGGDTLLLKTPYEFLQQMAPVSLQRETALPKPKHATRRLQELRGVGDQ